VNRFALPDLTPVIIEHINLRDENHGDEKVPAIDIKLSKEMHNDVLKLFNPRLKSWLYFKSKTPQPRPDQVPLELEEPNDAPDLRFPELDVLKWHGDQEGCTLTFEYGLAGKSNVKITDCKANNFRLECKQGGTVKVTWRVQRSQPDERAVGKLSAMLKHEVQAMMVPSAESQAMLDSAPSEESGGDPNWPFAESSGAVNGVPINKPADKKSRKPKDATDEFVERHGTTTSGAIGQP
jgi:hypothetical protein